MFDPRTHTTWTLSAPPGAHIMQSVDGMQIVFAKHQTSEVFTWLLRAVESCALSHEDWKAQQKEAADAYVRENTREGIRAKAQAAPSPSFMNLPHVAQASTPPIGTSESAALPSMADAAATNEDLRDVMAYVGKLDPNEAAALMLAARYQSTPQEKENFKAHMRIIAGLVRSISKEGINEAVAKDEKVRKESAASNEVAKDELPKDALDSE